MEEVAGAGRTVLFVSHNLAAVTQLCQRGIWLDHAKVRLDDTADKVVEAYISEQVQYLAQREWTFPGDAPGDERVRLLAARVIQNGCTSAVIDINESCTIELDFCTLKLATNLINTIFAFNATGLCLFTSADWRPNSFQVGSYRQSVHIPAQTFAESAVSLTVQQAFFDPEVRCVYLENCLGFEAIESDDINSIRGLYKGP